jgi:calcium-dependent protein kinase
MWSAGVILYMMIVGHAPFDGETDEDIINTIKTGEFRKDEKRWLNSSPEVRDLIQHLLLVDADKRYSALDALQHKWFEKMNSNIINSNIPDEKIENFISNLLSYSIDSKLQEMVLTYIIHNMSKPKDTKFAVKLFFIFNKIGNGQLNKEELKEALINFGVTDDLLGNFDDIFTNLDGDRDNIIQFEEFLRGVLDKREILTDDVLNYAFNFFDKENSGFIKVENIKDYFIGTHVNEEIFNNIFNEIDNNHDGKIDFDEFKNMMIFA